jgi:hypothetical protein
MSERNGRLKTKQGPSRGFELRPQHCANFFPASLFFSAQERAGVHRELPAEPPLMVA